MTFGGKKSTFFLFLGDVAVFVFSLWLTLIVRYLALPTASLFLLHFAPFSALFCVWVLVFYMAGLYSKQAIFFKNTLWDVLLRIQSLNIVLAALFFFSFPGIGITPKTNLVLYLIISLILIFIWRIFLFPQLTRPGSRERAAIIGEGTEVDELVREVNTNKRYRFEFVLQQSPKALTKGFAEFADDLAAKRISLLVVDTAHDAVRPLLPDIYELAIVRNKSHFADFYNIYEEVFDRVPLSLLQYEWFLKNVSNPTSNFYSIAKRTIDVIGATAMGIITILLVPFIFLALRFESSGPLFIYQMRIGENGKRVLTYKFRSMRFADQGVWKGENENRITRIGSILRKTSLDEFPQFINVLRGDISLVGPRNDMEALGNRLAEAIPYYNIRYSVKPGITGWAQINQQYEQGNISPQSIEETKTRLAYDFYYIKNRSFALDIVIALKTIKRMFFRVGSW